MRVESGKVVRNRTMHVIFQVGQIGSDSEDCCRKKINPSPRTLRCVEQSQVVAMEIFTWRHTGLEDA
jgi:hypothetical protein